MGPVNYLALSTFPITSKPRIPLAPMTYVSVMNSHSNSLFAIKLWLTHTSTESDFNRLFLRPVWDWEDVKVTHEAMKRELSQL